MFWLWHVPVPIKQSGIVFYRDKDRTIGYLYLFVFIGSWMSSDCNILPIVTRAIMPQSANCNAHVLIGGPEKTLIQEYG